MKRNRRCLRPSRRQLVGEVVRPALEGGMVVVSDRFYDSTTVYQIQMRVGCRIYQVAEPVCSRSMQSDRCTFLLDLNVEESRVRQMRRVCLVGRQDRMEQLTKDFFERVRRGYLELRAQAPHRVKIIDASRTEDQVEEAIWDEIDGLLN